MRFRHCQSNKMTLEEKNNITNSISLYRTMLSNAGTRPTITVIKNKAQEIRNFVENPTSNEIGLIALVAPDPDLTAQFFKGWKSLDFDKLAEEISKL